MAEVGAEANPLRVAIIGSGPAGFYTVSNFLKKNASFKNPNGTEIPATKLLPSRRRQISKYRHDF